MASATTSKWKNFNLQIVNQQIIPRYKELATAARKLQNKSKAFCATYKHQNFINTQSAFQLTMDAWQAIQHINYGPIEYSLRAPNLQFWPDKKNHISKQLNKLIASNDPERLGERFNRSSVSIKGLPAIERLLYSEKSEQQLVSNAYRCQVLLRITQNISEISQDLGEEWQTYMLDQFEDADQEDGFFENDLDATTAIIKTIIEPIEIIRDLKLNRPLASALSKAKYKRLESWRSQRSLRNIKINIDVIESAAPILAIIIDKNDAQGIKQIIKKIGESIALITPPLRDAIRTENGHTLLKQLSTQLSALHKILETAVGKQGIHLGFNSRDGD
jgi:predicted lipoprotein